MSIAKAVMHFDTMAVMHAAILTQVHTPGLVGTRRYAVTTQSDRYYELERIPFARLNIAVGYSHALSNQELGPKVAAVPLDERDGGSQPVSWLSGDWLGGEYYITAFPFDPNQAHPAVHYNPQSIEVVVVYTAASNDDPKAGFLVTELEPDPHVDYTRDWVIKQRPLGMSESDAFKLVKFNGRCTIQDAACWIHLMCIPKEEY